MTTLDETLAWLAWRRGPRVGLHYQISAEELDALSDVARAAHKRRQCLPGTTSYRRAEMEENHALDALAALGPTGERA